MPAYKMYNSRYIPMEHPLFDVPIDASTTVLDIKKTIARKFTGRKIILDNLILAKYKYGEV